VTGSETCLVIIAWHCDVIVTWHCDITVGIYICSLASLVFSGLKCRIYAGSSNFFGCYFHKAGNDMRVLRVGS